MGINLDYCPGLPDDYYPDHDLRDRWNMFFTDNTHKWDIEEAFHRVARAAYDIGNKRLANRAYKYGDGGPPTGKTGKEISAIINKMITELRIQANLTRYDLHKPRQN